MILFVVALFVLAVVALKARDLFEDPSVRPPEGGYAPIDDVIIGTTMDTIDVASPQDGADGGGLSPDDVSASGDAGTDTGSN